MHGVARGLQQLGNDRGRGGFPVASRDGENAAGAEREEKLHLRGEHAPPRLGGLKMGIEGHKAGRAENHILIKRLQIVLSQLKLCAERAQTLPGLAKLRKGTPVAGRHVTPVLQQKLDERRVAHTDAEHRDALIPN